MSGEKRIGENSAQYQQEASSGGQNSAEEAPRNQTPPIFLGHWSGRGRKGGAVISLMVHLVLT